MFIELSLILLTVLLLIFFIFVPYNFVNVRPKTILAMSKLPGPRALPLIGIIHILSKLRDTDYLNFLKCLRRDYPRIGAFWVIGIPYAIISEPDDLEAIMGSAHHIHKGIEYTVLTKWLQEGLLLSTGEKWHQRRKLLTPAFHFKILEDSMQSLNKHARCLLENMLKKDGQPFIVEELIVLCTLDIICETAMGYSLNLQTEEKGNIEYLKAVKRACTLVVERALTMCYNNDWVYELSNHSKSYFKNLRYLHDFTEKIIQDRKKSYTPDKQSNLENKSEMDCFHGKKKKAFLDILIELDRKDDNLFTDNDIREEVDTFMFEGHDTIHAALVHTLYLLGKHPDVQGKAYQELYEIFGESDRAANRNDLSEMNYLEMIIKESLRLYPSVPYISRCLTQELHLKDGVTLPSGLNIIIVPYILHRDERYFPNPEIFDPERFSVENCKNRHPYAYIPFSAGPRNCIGQKFAMMELKVVLSTIIRFAKINTVKEMDESNFLPIIILRSKEPIKIKITPRY